MCMSPHEMSSARIEEIVQWYKEDLEADPGDRYAQGQIDNFTAILKERAENGTYDTAGHQPGDRNETQRTEYQDA
jgi:hypothetical protein